MVYQHKKIQLKDSKQQIEKMFIYLLKTKVL